ncbi:sensor histidine kinase [Aestuariibaculum lutulentum]|uniref:histidine kinase n=1 Tax=Aestuariibaculum lutulentum TaxID=2920935 RepID=A0ABS9RGS4_9FLAO|nr:sensor histidine kinase [Aestuariibaculum lutulentum]MCH4552148.1 histidine kinase [Aestuariibaculum lutulentum]
MSIRTLILVIMNSLIFLVVLVLSVTFYYQFSKVLDDRILLQLNSIKTLKKVQIEKLIDDEWLEFNTEFANNDSLVSVDTSDVILPKNRQFKSGIYDLTGYSKTGKTAIGLILNKGGRMVFKVVDYNKIKSILLERTGMGNTGESYLVGEDLKMRSPSRFYPDSLPSKIKVETNGVISAFAGNEGRAVIKDYRDVDVYSLFSAIKISNLHLAILSEIDTSEVNAPLIKLKVRLFELILITMLIAVVLSLFLTKIITRPIINMQKSLKIMASGDYNQTSTFRKNSTEINEMFEALDNLKKSLQGAVKFSNEMGELNLNTEYVPKGNNDLLGKSLLKMRDKLIEFRNNENRNRMNTKRLLVDGLENERQRLSRELHDGIGPLLTSLKFYIENRIESRKKRTEMKQLLDATISEIRSMSNDLMPSTIDDFGVGAALSNFVESIKQSSDIDIEFEDLTNSENSKITKNQAINLFRIGQELINNTLKHANASQIRLTLSEFENFISFFYFDNGKGFDLNTVKLGSGIINIKERVEICQGDIDINSKEGRTTFEIELPINNE